MSAPRPLFNTMKLRLWLRRLSVSAPQMTVRRQLPWPLRLAIVCIVLGGVGAIAFGGYDFGRSLSGLAPVVTRNQFASLQEELVRLRSERDQYSTTVNSAESQLNIERSAQRQLAAQVKALEAENIKLKEDLTFFESLLPTDKNGSGVSIRSLKADMAGANQLRYRLLVMQGGKAERDFNGSAQLAVTVLQAGKSVIINFPDGANGDAAARSRFQLAFRHYQRLEGILTVPEGAVLQSVQARILEQGQVRAQQTTIVERNS